MRLIDKKGAGDCRKKNRSIDLCAMIRPSFSAVESMLKKT